MSQPLRTEWHTAPLSHWSASAVAAVANFPLWRAAAIAQSGFESKASASAAAGGKNLYRRYLEAVLPQKNQRYKGVSATVLGMTWARGAIFYGSDRGKKYLTARGVNPALAQTLPPLVISTLVQVTNMPLVRATVTLQDPNCAQDSVRAALRHLYDTRGVAGLFHGLPAGVLKAVPKYMTAVVVKDFMEDRLPPPSRFSVFGGGRGGETSPVRSDSGVLVRSGVKAVTAGLAGAVLTNPLDVLRNEMFKTDLGLITTYNRLRREQGLAFLYRGMVSNCVAVAIPIALTIFFTDVFERSLQRRERR